jgi:hypothetical protein
MDHSQHNRNVNFIWSIADDEQRDVYVKGKRQVKGGKRRMVKGAELRKSSPPFL